jgi:Zn-dependent protease with chaperone function
MNKLDIQLNKIQNNNIIKEDISNIITTNIIITVIYISKLIVEAKNIINATEYSKTLSDRLNKILNNRYNFKVHVYDSEEKDLNAFCFGFGKHIFITKSLIDFVTKRELDAILLHEAYHVIKKHGYKKMMIDLPFMYLITSMTTIFSLNLLAFGLLILLLKSVKKFTIDLMISRFMEYNADSFAVKYGYGKELISVFKKLKKIINKIKKNDCGKICQIILKLNTIIDEHPSLKNRIEKILKDENLNKKLLKMKNYNDIKYTLLLKLKK